MESRRESQFQDECLLETLIADRIPLKQNVDIWYGTREKKREHSYQKSQHTWDMQIRRQGGWDERRKDVI